MLRISKLVSLVAFQLLATVVISPAEAVENFQYFHNKAKDLASHSHYQQALLYERKAVDLEPNNPLAHKGLSIILSELGDLELAEKEALTAVRLAPKDAAARVNLGSILQSLERPADALLQYQQATALNAHDAAAGIGEAQCWLSLGQNAKAIELLERLAKENPQNTDVLINLSNAYLEAHELPDAEAAAQHAVLSDPSSYAARRILAEIAFEQHNLLHAIALGRQILARFPQQESAYLFLARCYAYQSALPREAGDLVVLAQQALPSNSRMFLKMGNDFRLASARIPSKSAYANERKQLWFSASTNALNAAAQAEPRNVAYRVGLSKLLLKQHKYQQALAQIKIAQELAPEDKTVRALQPAYRHISNDLAGAMKQWLHATH
jgi:tetratricopeptide (TPR) repeat protein